MVLSPSMFCYVRTGFTLFDVSFMFLFSRSEGSAGFTYITPTTISAINLVYNVGLFLGKWSVLWWREMLRAILYSVLYFHIALSRLVPLRLKDGRRPLPCVVQQRQQKGTTYVQVLCDWCLRSIDQQGLCMFRSKTWELHRVSDNEVCLVLSIGFLARFANSSNVNTTWSSKAGRLLCTSRHLPHR